MTSTPSLSFLAEWQRQEAVLIAWPFANSDWQPWLESIQQSYVELTAAIAESATPLILCQDENHREDITRQLGAELSAKVCLVPCSYNDTWCRDYGPIGLGDHSGLKSLVSFEFTGWGDKYEAGADNQVNESLNRQGVWNLPVTSIAFDLEGGAIETDGEGTLLTTEACLMAGNRNESMSKDDVDAALKRYLGVERVIWLTEGFLIGDDTDSHVDNLVRFANPDTLVYACCDNPEDSHYAPLKAMEAEVKSLTRRNGEPYRCLPLMIPEARYDESGTRLPASYVNFLILNDTVIVPTFQSPYDDKALAQLQTAFPDHRLIAVNGSHLIKQYGGPHCATMQLPRHALTPDFPGGKTC